MFGCSNHCFGLVAPPFNGHAAGCMKTKLSASYPSPAPLSFPTNPSVQTHHCQTKALLGITKTHRSVVVDEGGEGKEHGVRFCVVAFPAVTTGVAPFCAGCTCATCFSTETEHKSQQYGRLQLPTFAVAICMSAAPVTCQTCVSRVKPTCSVSCTEMIKLRNKCVLTQPARAGPTCAGPQLVRKLLTHEAPRPGCVGLVQCVHKGWLEAVCIHCIAHVGPGSQCGQLGGCDQQARVGCYRSLDGSVDLRWVWRMHVAPR